MSKRFFISDTHFGSDAILFREDRPFDSIAEFEQYEIKLWNSQTAAGDIIYFIGDFVEHTANNENWDACFYILKKLNANIILIMGNNEERIVSEYFGGDFEKFRQHCIDKGFKDVKRDEILIIDGKEVYLVHEPTKHREGVLNLFGHTHRSTGLWKPFGINVGCDLNHFRLHSEESIIKLFGCKEKYWDNDPDNWCMGSGAGKSEEGKNFYTLVDDFNKLDIRVGTIVSADVFENAKRPAYKLKVDFGKDLGIKNSSAQITEQYTPQTLLGRQVLAVVNFPPRQIADFMSQVLVLGIYSADGVVLISPDKPVQNGDKLG